MSKIQLYYYPAQGLAQQIRYTLVASGIEFEDVCCSFPPTEEDKALWLKLGKNTTTNIPMLVDGDAVYTQSLAVLRLVARRGGLMPTAEGDLFLVDKLIGDVGDLRTASYKAVPMMGATPESQADWAKNVVPKHVGNLERQLGEKEYFVGGKLSVADIAVYDILTTMCRSLLPDCLTAYPKLDAFVKRVEGHEKIAQYRQSEKFSKLMAFPPLQL